MALKRITLRDFVIVQALDLELGTGFTALTGETGAGKSILIDALQLTLGARADAGAIREGAQRTDVHAEFDCPGALHPWLEEAGFEADDSLLLRRTVDSTVKAAPGSMAAQPQHLNCVLLASNSLTSTANMPGKNSPNRKLCAVCWMLMPAPATKWSLPAGCNGALHKKH